MFIETAIYSSEIIMSGVKQGSEANKSTDFTGIL
jgi:hypothetical protein